MPDPRAGTTGSLDLSVGSAVASGLMRFERGTRRRLRRLALLVLAIEVAVATVGVAYWAVRRPTADTTERALRGPVPAAVGGASLPLMIEDGYAVAASRAATWVDETSLFSIAAQVDWPRDRPDAARPGLPPTGFVDAVFLAPDRDGDPVTLSLELDRTTGAVVAEEEVVWAGRPAFAPVTLGGQAVSSGEAMLVAEQAGGRRFRLACPDQRYESRISLLPGPVASTTPNTPPVGDRPPSAGSTAGRTGGEVPSAASPVPAAGSPPVVASPAIAPSPGPGSPAAAPVSASPVAVRGGPGSTGTMTIAPPTVPSGVWLVTYRQGAADGALAIRVDAATGTVLAVNDQRLGCEED